MRLPTALYQQMQQRSPPSKRFSALMFAAGWVAALAATACGCGSPTDAPASDVRIGYQKAGMLNLVRMRGTLEPLLEPLGLRVEWVGFPAGPQLLEALNAGAIDFGQVGDAPPILAQAAGVSFVYAVAEPERSQAEAIAVRQQSSLKSVADLAGKRVALNKGSNVHYLLVRALAAAQVPYDAVEKIYLTPSDARAAFEGEAIDAWAAWDPYLAEAELNAGARVLVDGKGLVANRELHVASRRLVDHQPDAVRALVAALVSEDRWVEDHPDEAAEILAAEVGLELEVMRRVIDRKAYGSKLVDDEVLTEQQQVADAFLEAGLIPRAIDVRDAALPTSFIEESARLAHEGGRAAP